MANEKRLIDAMQTVTKMSGRITPLLQMGANPVQVYNEALQVIAESSTVDAVEVVHGRWRKTYTCSGEWLWGYECDQCKADSPRASYYCPNCGAVMMDGDGNG